MIHHKLVLHKLNINKIAQFFFGSCPWREQVYHVTNQSLMTQSGVSRRKIAKWVTKFNFQYLILELFDSMYPLDE